MGPFSVLQSLSVLSHVLGAVDKTSSSFSAHGKIGDFIVIIIVTCDIGPQFYSLRTTKLLIRHIR